MLARVALAVALPLWAQMAAPLAISLILFTWRSRMLHYLGLAALYLVMARHYVADQIN